MRLRRQKGFPTSANGASSFHLHWYPPQDLREASVTLEVLVEPTDPHLYFWALQASFTSAEGVTGAGHLGLQWYRAHPGWPAINWGGYAADGHLLDGSVSALPSASGDANTRSFPWSPRVPYRLRIYQAADGWAGEVTDRRSGASMVVRNLFGGGDRLSGLMVWSEVFARCDDPPTRVRWSEPAGITVWGAEYRPTAYRVSYQPYEAGGCQDTDVVATANGVEQLTSTARHQFPDSLIRTGQEHTNSSR